MKQADFNKQIMQLLGEFHPHLAGDLSRSLDWRAKPEVKAELLRRANAAAMFCDQQLSELTASNLPEKSLFEHIEAVRYGFLYAISIMESSERPSEPAVLRRAAAKRGQRQIRFR